MKLVILSYLLTIFALSIYSYALIDPNITFFQHPLWVAFRDPLVQFGYYYREWSWLCYFLLVVLLFIFSYYCIKRYKKINPISVAFIIGVMLLISYPFLSHDFFNYMFDAKILTYYGKNPYLFKALDFPYDKWIRFMHWTHRSYPYGPVFLILTLIPSLLGFGKFALTFILFKGMYIMFYLACVLLLNRLNRKWAIFFATHPLIIMEGLISSHNDFIALALGIIGVYFLFTQKHKWGRIFFLGSVGIKFMSVPIFFLRAPAPRRFLSLLKSFAQSIFSHSYKKRVLDKLRNNQNILLFALQIVVILVFSLHSTIQPWYFLSLFVFIPFVFDLLSKLWIFFFGLLISYYPYVRLGGWGSLDNVDLKNQIIFIFAVTNIIYLLILSRSRKSIFTKH